MKRISFISLLLSLFLVFCSKEDDTAGIPKSNPLPPSAKTLNATEVGAFKAMTIYGANFANRIAKWPGEVPVFFVDSNARDFGKRVDSVIAELNSIDSNLKVFRVYSETSQCLKLYYRSRTDYTNEERDAAGAVTNSNYIGYAMLYYNDKGVVYRSHAFVDSIRIEKGSVLERYTLCHELMHAIGFIGHVTAPDFPTIMPPVPVYPIKYTYTDFDRRAIRLLYNPAIFPGMTEKEFNDAIPHL